MGDVHTAFVKPSLEEAFRSAWETCRVLLFSAPCGCGKTVTAAELLRGKSVFRFSAGDDDFPMDRIPAGAEVVLVDDLQNLTDSGRQEVLCTAVRTRSDLHFVLLGRCCVPGWLIPFQLAGILQTFATEDLLFDRETSRRMLEARGVTPTPLEVSFIFRDLKGYPIGVELLSRKLAGGKPYSGEALAATKRDLFAYYDEAVLRRFELSLRSLLLSLAPFDYLHGELAQMVSGEERAGELLGTIQRDTTMLVLDGLDTCHFRPIFREYLLRKFNQTMTDSDRSAVYSRAALYYELHGELRSALTCYASAGQTGRVSALLVKNAEQHPGVGHYRELQDYYFALPNEEILRSPSLMCGMSMLTSLTMDYESSEQWYHALESYAARLEKKDSEYQAVRGKLAYLDIALPQRGSKSLIRVIDSVFHVMLDKQLKVPAFSVTSMLPSVMNGGKDFCEWSKKDDILYATMRAPVEAVLGRDGIGLADEAICESKFEKGENVSDRMLTLMARLGEIQARGTPDIEFAVIGLLARIHIFQGKAETALQSIENLRDKYEKIGETRFLGNIDAMCVRVQLRRGDESAARRWLESKAPKNDVRLWAMWRYQYLTRVMVQLAEGQTEEPLLLLARLAPYCETCGRIMDALHVRILSAICRYRQGNEIWKEEFDTVLDMSLEYKFIWPVAQYGVAVQPLLKACGWTKHRAFLEKLTEATRTQAVYYPKFLRPSAPITAPLSPTELQVLRLVCQNLSNQEICEILSVKLPTVKSHVSHILQKLGVQNRSEAKEAAETLRLL